MRLIFLCYTLCCKWQVTCFWVFLCSICLIICEWNIFSLRLVKENLGNGKSQETLDSVGLQTSLEKGDEELEETRGEGNYIAPPKMALTLATWLIIPSPWFTETFPSSCEDKWCVIVDRASLLFIQALSGVFRLQELCWRLMELHGFKIVSSGIIWVSLGEVGRGYVGIIDINFESIFH